jgi:hypothetical protein
MIRLREIVNYFLVNQCRGGSVMSIQEKARQLMVRQHQQAKNRQQSMLMRAAQELGLHEGMSHYWNPIQGKMDPATQTLYGRSQATMS